MKVLKIIWNVIRYIIGGILVLFGLVSLFSSPLPGVFLTLCGLTTMPFLYSILRKTKMIKGLIIALAISMPIVFFIIFVATVPTDSETMAKSKIRTSLQKITTKYFQKSIISIDKEKNGDKYIVNITDNLKEDGDYNVAGCYAIDFINFEKGLVESDNVDDMISLFIYKFKVGKAIRYGIEYANNDDNMIEELIVKDYKTGESITYTSTACVNYKTKIEEEKKQKENAKKAEEAAIKAEEKRKEEEAAATKAAEDAQKAEEKRKKDTSVVHNVGETVKCPYFDITLNSFQVKKEGTYINSYFYISDPEWIGVILTLYNTSTDTHSFSSSNVTLQNSSGELIGHSLWNYDIWGAEMLNSPTLVSGGTKTGYISYANTNQDDSNLILIVSCNDGFLSKDTEYKYYLR